MKTDRNTPDFKKASSKSASEIKATCEKIKDAGQTDYDIRSNGNHIWVEVEPAKQHYWSPLLRLELEKSDGHTFIKGQFAENPLLWVVFLLIRLASCSIFILSGIAAWLKYTSGQNFNIQLFVMFGMLTVWFGLFLASERYKRKGAGQMAELRHFAEQLA